MIDIKIGSRPGSLLSPGDFSVHRKDNGELWGRRKKDGIDTPYLEPIPPHHETE